jgi:hypothetical protein
MQSYIATFVERPRGFGILNRMNKFINGRTVRDRFMSYQGKIASFRLKISELCNVQSAACLESMRNQQLEFNKVFT